MAYNVTFVHPFSNIQHDCMMTIHFYLRFGTTYGQQFFVSGNIPQLGNNDTALAAPLHYVNDEFWMASIDVANDTGEIAYKYILRGADGTESTEWLPDRVLNTRTIQTTEVQLVDYWNYTGNVDNAFFTQPFQETLLKPKAIKYKAADEKNATHIFRIKAPLLKPNEAACLLGSGPKLADWNTAAPLLMAREGNWFTAALNLSQTEFPVYYKYGVYNLDEKRFVQYEQGDNRVLYGMGKRQTNIVHDGMLRVDAQRFRGAGVAIPVFSLRTKHSMGVGEFTDLKTLADWAASVGMKMIQLLPVNDTTVNHSWTDSYPYAPISVFALHPIYLNVAKMAGKGHTELIKGLASRQKKLNALTELDYEAVIKAKWTAIKELYAAMKQAWLADEGYQAYYNENKHWLLPYAAFCYLRDKYKTANFGQWKTHSSYKTDEVAKLFAPKSKAFDAVAIHLFVQFHLHQQLKEAVDYAHQKGIVMKGDLPIGIYRNSSDAWVAPDLYNMEAQAGAPPDDFAVKGQNWGFPTYNWKRMQEDGFTWWKQRFAQMSLYFDAFRIDHILGFFRIWSIPMHAVEGIMGHFVPCLPVHVNEFAEKGISFDYNRYCKPLITDEILGTLFGEKTDWIKETFLEGSGWGNYAFKADLDTQRKIETWFADAADVEAWIKLKLFDLVSNFILIEEEESDGRQFHFRIAMDDTLSYRYLDSDTKAKLKELYINYFFRRQDDFWRKQALQKLPALKSSTCMLICGEDLGMVPDCVPGVMRDTGLLSLEIQRMPKNPKTKFFHPADAPYMSVVTPSTHDMSTIRGWWEENRDNTQAFYNTQLGQWGEAPFYCEPWINRAIITQHAYSPAMWSIFQLQDLMGSDGQLRRQNPHDERINVPANPKHYWRYRMHISLEELQEQKAFNDDLHGLLAASGRTT